MATISVTLPTDGTTADVADYNTPVTTIVNEINGNLDNDNIDSAAAISGSKLADNSIDITAKASSFDGWIEVSDSWTYASATTITVPSDATTKYSVGDKIKLVQTTTKYFYITGVASTTLTINGGTDYTLANAAISEPNYSKAATPLAFPEWFTYAPTLTNLSGGTQTVARFCMKGKVVHLRFKYTLAGAGVAGLPRLTLPVTAVSTYAVNDSPDNTTTFLDATGFIWPGMAILPSTAAVDLYYINTSQNIASTTSTTPFTWAASDRLMMQASYEAA